eukprot:gene42215-57157_t
MIPFIGFAGRMSAPIQPCPLPIVRQTRHSTGGHRGLPLVRRPQGQYGEAMRIAICTTPFVPNIGGIENLSEMTADALGRGGDDVTVLTLQP